MSITKGGSILVKVEDLTGELISVKLIDGDKIFRGILLQETIGKFNEYGTNLERITSAPFWPPLSGTASGINLKTIPCSTERYSYKLEGQPSNLNVFQPDPTKRSHRNQPAPQLSRILRPRRFVCRKCKKAFHLEEHGTELSSSFFTDQIDRRTSDSSALNSDNEINHYLPKSNFSDQITLATLNGNSQSIRHVTPPIIPKLNEEMKINVDDSSKSEVDSSSDMRSKSKKHFISEQSTKTPESLEPKLVMSKKRKVDVIPDKQKLKKIRLNSQKLTEPINVSNTILVVTPPVVNPDSSSDPAVPSSEETKDFPTSSSLVGKTDPVDSLSSQEQTRKNRIKAQYVSVTSPFRYPFGKKTRISSKQEIGNINSISDSRIKVESNATRKGSEKSEIISLTSSKTNLGIRKNSRYRTRTQLNPLSVTLDSLGPSCSVKDLESRPEVDEILPSDSLDGDFPQKENIPNSISPRLSSPSKEKHSASLQLTCKTSTYGHNSASNNSGISMVESNFSPQSRRKAFDYEKPKNRWMREARARRCQDERNSNPSSATASHISTSSNNTDMENSVSCNAQSPSLNRLRIRSGDGSSVSPSESTLKSNSNISSKVKLHNGSLNSRNIESEDASQSEKYLDIADQKSTSHVSPCLTPTSDSSGLALPVIKIKINRNRQPSGCSKTVPTQYEVVKLQTDSHLELTTSASKVLSEENSSIANANPSALKLDIPCNGLRSPSPSPSASSSKKGSTCESLIISGPLVKRCKLHDGIVFRVGDLVWSKLSGWPYWPAQITSIQRVVANEVDLPNSEQVRTVVDFQEQSSSLLTSEHVCYTACLHWFAWNQVSYMPCDKLFHFLEHCKRFDNKKKRGVFRQAVNEAKQAAEKRQETHFTDSESEWDHEVFGSTIHQQSLSQPSEISVLDDAKESEVSQTASSLSIPDINLGVEVNATTKQSKHPNNKVRRNKTKVSCDKQEPSMLCPSVVDSSNVSLGQTTYDNISGEVTASIESKLHVISKRRSKQQTKNKVYANTSEDKKMLVEQYNSSLTNNNSNVRLKIILSKPKLKSKLNCAEVLNNNAQNSFENEVNIPSLPNLDVPITDDKIHQIVENSSKEDTESPFTSEIIPESNISTTDSQDFDKTFSATHSELLTQFPHVFPDLKVSGILSDTVDIPTFSEDESEEEDAGRLIIDPDVMASVNVPLSTGNHHYITETLKQDPDVLREDLYSLSSDNMSYNHELSSQAFDSIHPYSRTSSTTLTQPLMSNFGNPVYSSSDSFTHSFNSSTYSMECLISQPVSVYPTHNQSLIQTVVPRLTTPILASSTVSNLSVPSRSAYFQSNHLNVTSTTTHNVSYVTTEYSTL
ncbi:unnamed protein product [Schistosoma margrebowiei]|uniref:Uncharacterized protein n=1 Tax=Schistosoma margrebowiei TaxID=48269 RepID=A0A183MEW2_9TREM|nr:unnamed protein product [Schistosoma margrebowiei]